MSIDPNAAARARLAATPPQPLSDIRERIETLQTKITKERPLAEEVLIELQHDMRTPIGNILACVTLFRMEDGMTASQSELVDMVEQAAQRMIKELDRLRSITDHVNP